MNDTQCAETPLSDHVARFWKYLETETVRIVLDLKRVVGVDAPDGPVVYWDGATFSDDVAKAVVAERSRRGWKPICDRPELDHQPGRQFIRLEGSRDHSGLHWGRVYCGIAYTRPLGSPDEMLQYRKSDIIQMCKEGDMDEWTAVVTHWMPAIFPPLPPATNKF